MKRDFSVIILDYSGKPYNPGASLDKMTTCINLLLKEIPDDRREDITKALNAVMGEAITYGSALAYAVTAPVPNEVLAPGEAVKRFKLAQRIVDGGIVDITPEERDLLKDRISKAYNGAVLPGAVAMMLEGEKEEG